LKLTTDRHEASRGFFATTELLVIRHWYKECDEKQANDYYISPSRTLRLIESIKHCPEQKDKILII